MANNSAGASGPLAGKVVLITGAAQGLGKAAARAFGVRGAMLAMADLNEALLNETADELRGAGAECVAIAADIAASGAPQAIVRRTVETFGRIDILVNNAAVSSVEALLDVTEAEWDKVFNVNVKALFFLLQAAARAMKGSGGGRIVNISSPATRMTLTNYTSYATSKAAVDYITRTAAAALGPFGITVNAVAPGRMDTPMQQITEQANAAAAGIDLQTYIQSRTVDIPMRRRTTPAEVAEGIVWLATQEASYVTANRLNISGGLELD
jgi:NAD(P)-dependent dehydrogenase (short-subunit alcohol dehydrogenase family)